MNEETDLPSDKKEEDKATEEVELMDIPFPSYEEKVRKTLPTGWYEATIIEAGQVPNRFYDPAEQAELHKNQFQVDLEVFHEDEMYSLRTWTSLTLFPGNNKAKKSYLWAFLEALGEDPKTFTGLPSILVGKKLKLNVKKVTEEDNTFNRVIKGEYESVI